VGVTGRMSSEHKNNPGALVKGPIVTGTALEAIGWSIDRAQANSAVGDGQTGRFPTFQNRRPAPKPSLRPVVPAYPSCYLQVRLSRRCLALPSFLPCAPQFHPQHPRYIPRVPPWFFALTLPHPFLGVENLRRFKSSTVQHFSFQLFAASLSLFALFFNLSVFVFNRLRPLLPKPGGWGTPSPTPLPQVILSATPVPRSYCAQRHSLPPLPGRTQTFVRALPVSLTDRGNRNGHH